MTSKERVYKWRILNRDKYLSSKRISSAKWRLKNRDVILQYKKEYYENNKDKYKIYYLNNKDKFNKNPNRSRNKPYYPSEYWKSRNEILSSVKSCEYCFSAEKLHTHHIISTGVDNKINYNWNLMVLCSVCHTKVHSIFGKKMSYFNNIVLAMTEV